MNYLIITIDALSKWYIDQVKKENSFWQRLEKNTYSFENMYSMGPFTEAAVRGFWDGSNPLEGYSYLSESCFENETIFDKFSKSHYMYMGELIPYLNYEMKVDNKIVRENREDRAFEHLWSTRIQYYKRLANSRSFNSGDRWQIEFILDSFFEKYGKSHKVKKEADKYFANKDKYIEEIFNKGELSSFYYNLSSDLVKNCKYRNITSITNQKTHKLLEEEALFIKMAKNKNILLAINNEANSLDDIESVLEGEKNRCLISNSDLLSQMRDENERLPKLKEEIDQFLEWYDSEKNTLSVPFFAYIHNYDFHFAENILNSRREDELDYVNEIRKLMGEINNLEQTTVSVSKQLCIHLIERNLEYLWNELENRKVFDDTCVIITADHGISNFMNPVKKSNNRWNYTRTNFNVPLYIKAPSLDKRINPNLTSSRIFGDLLEQINNEKKGLKISKDDYLFTAWVNGIVDYNRNCIKIGIRNEKWSITCEGFYFQSFSSLNILGIYNLERDPNEIKELSYSEASLDVEFSQLLKIMGKEWFNLVRNLLEDKLLSSTMQENNFGMSKIISEDSEWFEENRRIEQESFMKFIDKKDVILFGLDKPTLLRVLEELPMTCGVKEIWNTQSADNKRILGHVCVTPHQVVEDIPIIVCDKDEINAVSVLNRLNIKNYLFYNNIIRK